MPFSPGASPPKSARAWSPFALLAAARIAHPWACLHFEARVLTFWH